MSESRSEPSVDRLEGVLRALTDEQFAEWLGKSEHADRRVRAAFASERRRRRAASRPGAGAPPIAAPVEPRERNPYTQRAWWLLTLITLLALWHLIAPRASLATPAAASGRYTVEGVDALNVRREPTADARVVGELSRHDAVAVLNVHGGWTRVTAGRDDVPAGWVRSSFLAAAADPDSAAPWWSPRWWYYVPLVLLLLSTMSSHGTLEATRCARCGHLRAWTLHESRELDRWVGSDATTVYDVTRVPGTSTYEMRPYQPRQLQGRQYYSESTTHTTTRTVYRTVTKQHMEDLFRCRHCGDERIESRIAILS